MTATSPRATSPEVVPFPFDHKAWGAWLTSHTDPQWRPDEWNQQYWLFTGDPDKEATAIWRCYRAGCHVAARASRHLCRSCYGEWRDSGLSREEFVTASRKAPLRALPGSRPQCAAGKDKVRCRREATTMGGCTAHYSKWKSQARAGKTRLPFSEWLADAEPVPPSRPCMITACDSVSDVRLGLCAYHGLRWRRHCQSNVTKNASRQDLLAWAAIETPRLNGYQFSLMPLNPLLRREILYGLAQRDTHRPTLSPVAGRLLVRGLAGAGSLVTLTSDQLGDYGYLDRNCEAHWRDVLRLVRSGFDQFRGVGPLDKPVWELTEIGLTSRTQTGLRILAGQVDSTQIRQQWLRGLLASWVKEVSPDTNIFRRAFEACRTASQALDRRPGGGHDPAALKVTDMDAIVEAIKRQRRKDGGELGYSTRAEYLRCFCQLLDFGRRLEIADSLASGFARHNHHTIPHEDPGEDTAGKAIPEFVIAQLDAAIDRIGAGVVYGKHDPAAVQLMLQTVYILLRDTGRRPWEIRWLRTDCLDTGTGEYVLIWDNKKSRRKRRRLEISRDTASVIQRWLTTRATLQIPARSRSFLFPAASRHSYDACIDADTVGRMLRRWVDDLPELHSDVLDADGSPLPFDRSKIFAYAFRHTYAQRHADAGTDLHVLRDLMDHKSVDTTLGYFQVSQKRRRQAVETLRMHVVDRDGNPTPTSSALAYEARSVAVPFGNCTEPSNVKAGGQNCPIRFQCSGCGFYRPDPSFLLAIEDHIRALKADLETAQAQDAAAFVIRNLRDQISSFQTVVARIRAKLAAMPEAERLQIEEASTVLRKIRASAPAPVLPIPQIPARNIP